MGNAQGTNGYPMRDEDPPDTDSCVIIDTKGDVNIGINNNDPALHSNDMNGKSDEGHAKNLMSFFNALCDFFEVRHADRPEFEKIISRRCFAVQWGQFTTGTMLLDGTKSDTSSKSFYVIEMGQVIVVDTNGGCEMVLGIGQYFSCVGKDLKPCNITARVIADCCLWSLSHEEMLKLQYSYNLYRINENNETEKLGSLSIPSSDRTNDESSSSGRKKSKRTSSPSSSPSPPSSSSSTSSLQQKGENAIINELVGDLRIMPRISHNRRVSFNPTVQVILMATKEEYMAWGVKSDIWYCERDYTKFRSDRALAASMGETEDIFFGTRGVAVSKVDGNSITSVFGRHELDDTLSKASRESTS